MRKWWIAFIAGAVVVGCAGGTDTATGTTGGGATTGSTGGTTTGGREVPVITMPTQNAGVQLLFLSGQGRRAPGSQFAQLSNIRLTNGPLDQIPTDITGSLDGVNLKLDGFTTNTYGFSQTISEAFRPYTAVELVVTRVQEEQFGGSLSTVWNGAQFLPAFPINGNIARGRTLSVQIYLNDGSLFYDPILDTVVFDQAAWEQDNLLNGETSIPGFFSDALAFDLSGVPTKPTMQSSSPADKLLVTGDSVGLASGSGTNGSFDLYSPSFVESGVLLNPVPDLLNGTAPGTYTVLEPDTTPFAPPGAPPLPALQGQWRNINEVASNLGTQSMIIVPSSKPNGPHQVVMIRRTGTTIDRVWIGRATITGSTGTFEAWSVDQVDNNTENNKVTGTLGNITAFGNRVIDGDYTVTATATGFPFAGSGVFVVYN